MSVSPDSLADPLGDGDGAFRSQRDRESCLQAASGGVKCDERCMASELFSADGLSLPLCNAQCYLVDTSLVDILGGELFMAKGSPMPTPAMGVNYPCARFMLVLTPKGPLINSVRLRNALGVVLPSLITIHHL